VLLVVLVMLMAGFEIGKLSVAPTSAKKEDAEGMVVSNSVGVPM